jgi:hypothetical protein
LYIRDALAHALAFSLVLGLLLAGYAISSEWGSPPGLPSWL